MSSRLSRIRYTRCPVPTPVGLAAQLGLDLDARVDRRPWADLDAPTAA